jgi:hypothetical protein
MLEALFWLARQILRIFGAFFISIIFYWFFLASIHVEFYAYRMGIDKKNLWTGDSIGLFLETIPIMCVEIIVFYLFIRSMERKLKGEKNDMS